ncbi:MAG: rod shape-determining protein RodA [Acidobacteriota bacterium]
MLEHRELHTFDWPLLGAVVAVCATGLLMLASATYQNPALDGLVLRQAAWMGIGFAGLLAVLAVDYRTLAEMSGLGYIAGILVLIYLLIFGRAIAGTRGWLELGPVNLQPAELVKIILIVVVAAAAANGQGLHLRPAKLAALVGLGGVPLLLILAQPDLGTAVMLMPPLLAIIFVAGMRLRVMLALLLLLALAAPVAWCTTFKDYQKERVRTFFDPQRDPSGAGYQVRQSKIAVGSGELTGKGLFQGTQSQLQFLPAQHTDFIFAVLAAETGFLGAATVVCLYFFITMRCLLASRQARDRLGRYLALGIGSLFGCQALVNLGMMVGLTPTIGIPLPLMSYGGSSMVATLLGFGLVLNVRMRRFVN